MTDHSTSMECSACLNGCGGVRLDCPNREGGPVKRPMAGRPSSYTEDVASAICDMLADGQSLREICKRDDMPHRVTVLRWLDAKPDFAAKYARARERQADAMDDLILEVANSTDGENFQASKVKIGAYQWRASKLKPKVYGDKITQEVSGPGGGPMVTSTITTTDPVEAARAYQKIIRGG